MAFLGRWAYPLRGQVGGPKTSLSEGACLLIQNHLGNREDRLPYWGGAVVVGRRGLVELRGAKGAAFEAGGGGRRCLRALGDI